MTKKKNTIPRPSLTMNELEALSWEELLELKLSDEEKILLKEINKKREDERLEIVKRLMAESHLLLKELQATGLNIDNVGQLPSISEPYQNAIPILIRHLKMPYSDSIKDCIARGLAVKEARYAWDILVSEYKNAPMGKGITAPGDSKERPLGFKNGLACALAATVTDETLTEYLELVKDKSHGEYRVILLSAIKKRLKNPEIREIVEELASDPDLEKEIISWKLKKS